MSEKDLCHSIKLKRNIILPEELERKINSIAEHQRRYIRSIFLSMAQVNPTNGAILCDYLVAEQNELNIKESTKESTIKRIIWFSAFLSHKTFNEITKDDILAYLNSRIKKPASVDPTHKWIGTLRCRRAASYRPRRLSSHSRPFASSDTF